MYGIQAATPVIAAAKDAVNLSGKNVIIIGGTAGIGAALARASKKAGAHLLPSILLSFLASFLHSFLPSFLTPFLYSLAPLFMHVLTLSLIKVQMLLLLDAHYAIKISHLHSSKPIYRFFLK